MVTFRDFVGVDIAPVSKKTAVKLTSTYFTVVCKVKSYSFVTKSFVCLFEFGFLQNWGSAATKSASDRDNAQPNQIAHG